jgi:outer membrane protein assembly factor BamB
MRIPWTLVVGFVAGAALDARSQDWPCWRGAGRDGKIPGFQAPAAWPKELKSGWHVEVGEGHSSPALVGDKLYLHVRQGEEEVILCLLAASGKEVWRDKYPADAKFMLESAAKPHGKGPFSSLAVADGRVFALGIRGTLSCLEASSGKVLWRNDFKDRFPTPYPEWGAGMSPLVVGALCVVHVGGKDKGAIVGLDVTSGKTQWSWEGDGPGYASPIEAMIGGKPQLITLTQNKAVGLSPADGKLLWELEFKTNYDQNSVSPIVFQNLVILSGYSHGITAYRVDGGKPEEAWRTTDASMYMSTPLLKGDRLYGFSDKKRGQFFCLDAKTGNVLWTGDARQGENAALLDGGSVILALTTQRPDGKDPSNLVVFEASDKDYKELARYKVAPAPAWAHPLVAGSSLFVKDKTTLAQWTLP